MNSHSSLEVRTFVTLHEYHSQFGCKDGYEYWFGEVIKRSAPTWLHAILQILLGELLSEAGYSAGSELDLRIDPEWQPRPDVAATLQVEEPYPTRPIEIVAEVLSPGDDMHDVHTKCENYARIGIEQICVFDPRSKKAWEWDRTCENLERVDVLRLGNGAVIDLAPVWREMDRRAQRKQSTI